MATLSVALALPVKTGRCMKEIRRLQQTSNSAFVVLVALGAFMSNCFGRVGNSLAAVLTYNAVVRTWRRGQLHVRFMFSSVALNFLTPEVVPHFLPAATLPPSPQGKGHR